MIRRRDFAAAGLTAAALAAIEGFASANERGLVPAESGATMFDKCSRACADCQRQCDACATYCAKALAKGSAHHLESLTSCNDCATLCATAAQIVARQGMAADLICRACAETCARCATECERHGKDDPVMARCAEECRKCEAACREMLTQAAPERK